jgi:hypothetical protein
LCNVSVANNDEYRHTRVVYLYNPGPSSPN